MLSESGSGPRRGLLRPREGLARRERADAERAEHGVGVGQAGVSQRVGRLHLNRLPEVFDALPQPLLSPLVPAVAAPEIRVIRLGVVGVALGELRLLLARELQLQALGNPPR